MKRKVDFAFQSNRENHEINQRDLASPLPMLDASPVEVANDLMTNFSLVSLCRYLRQ